MATVVSTNTANVSSNVSNSVLFEMEGVLIGTSGPDTAIQMTGLGNSIIIHGAVFGERIGIDTGSAKNDTLDNGNEVFIGTTGTVDGGDTGIHMVEGRGAVTNHGLVSGRFGIQFENNLVLDADRVLNTGTINGRESAIDSTNASSLVVENLGTITSLQTAIGGSQQADAITNHGIILGEVRLLAGDDVYTGTGVVHGAVSLGLGDDSYTGSDAIDLVRGDAGADDIALGGGDDVYIDGDTVSEDGNDTVDGGSGIDTFVTAGRFAIVDLEQGFVVARGTGHDLIVNFENATGTSSADDMTGSAGANLLRGQAAADVMSGLAGDDRMIGGTGRDTIEGGEGRDVLTGGADRDIFVFNSANESRTGGALHDIITDFASRTDKIDLSLIDANRLPGNDGDQAFSFIGTEGFTAGTAGQLRYDFSPATDNYLVQGDTNGDAVADFEIRLADAFTFPVVGDFIL